MTPKTITAAVAMAKINMAVVPASIYNSCALIDVGELVDAVQ